jgi:hypothetical protein
MAVEKLLQKYVPENNFDEVDSICSEKQNPIIW